MAVGASVVRALVCGTVDLGESDRIVRLLVEGQGRVDARMGKARKSARRHRGGLDMGSIIQASLRTRGQHVRLTELKLLVPRLGIRSHLIRTALAAQVVEVAWALASAQEHDDALLQAADAWLTILDTEEKLHPLTRLAALLGLLKAAGLAPHLGNCLRCGGARHSLDPNEGGALCQAHGGGGVALDPAVWEALLAAQGGLSELPEQASWSGGAAAAQWVEGVVVRHLGRPLKTSSFLDSLRADPQRGNRAGP